ncbi:2520_t:CDS:2 [Gigaspora rosea]|nr:2520_t:CDS:2 [Gigaspora rosea]
MGISIQNSRWEKDWTISAHSEASIKIKSLLSKKDFEKGTHALCELNLWFVEQLIMRQDNTMLTWQQIKRICGLETKGKTPIWFKKLEKTILEDQISRRIKGSYAQQEEIMNPKSSQKKEKCGKKSSNKKVHILEWEENKENLGHNNSLSSSIIPTNKILKMRENEVADVCPWIKRKTKENGS